MQTVMLIDHDVDLLDLVAFALRRENYHVLQCADVGLALATLRRETPDLIVLDPETTGGHGWELLRRIRATTNTPLLTLSTAQSEQDVVRALRLGADDFVGKPFRPRELVARIEALLRRSSWPAALPQRPEAHIELGDLRLNPADQRVTRGQTEVRLTRTELRLLHHFMLNPDRVISAETLITHVWGYDARSPASRDLLRVGIRRLRQKLEPDPALPRYIETVAGLGYAFRPQQPPVEAPIIFTDAATIAS